MIDLNCTTSYNFCLLTNQEDSKLNVFKSFMDFDYIIINKLDLFKSNFHSFTHIIVLIDDNENFFKNSLHYIRKHSNQHKTFVCIDTADTSKMKITLKSNIDELLMKPYNFEVLNKLVFKHIREDNINKLTGHINSLNTEQLKDYYIEFFKIFKTINPIIHDLDHFINKHINKKNLSSLIDQINVNHSFKLPININSLLNDLKEHYKNIFVSPVFRYPELKAITEKLLLNYHLSKADYDIIKPLNKIILTNADELISHHKDSNYFFTVLKFKLAIEKRIISDFFKLVINENSVRKSRDIRRNCFHLMMASSSDILKNLTVNISSKDYSVSKLLKNIENSGMGDKQAILKYANIVTKKDKPVKELEKYLKNQSSLFLSYNDFIPKDTTIDKFIYSFKHIILNGHKIKNNQINIKLIKNSLITGISLNQIDENIVFPSFYELIKNSIEAHSKNIYIHFVNKEHYLQLLFKDDGIGFKKIDSNILFKTYYSTKGKSGIGLLLIKRWLNSININVLFNNAEQCIEVQIPYSKN